MQRIILMLAVVVSMLVPLVAQAVVRPPNEWFDSPAKQAEWARMEPVLKDWEFSEHTPLLGGEKDQLANIENLLGQGTAEVAQTLGVAQDSPELYKYDLNLDGMVDQFDVLELGYQVEPPQKRASIAPSFGTNEWIVLRADFQDSNANYGTYNAAYFEQRLFQENAPKPSCNDYYSTVSYGKLHIDGEVALSGPGGDGWFKGEHTKQWYINNGGDYLVREAVLAADDEVDFSQFDVDGDGYVDTVMVFYPDQVFSGGLWPHRSSGLDIHVDGVIVDSYFLTGYNTGNDSFTMTISSHEYGHILGLPDLYDVDGGSSGIGGWGLMSYQYDNDQKVPSPCPWSKIQLGWVVPTVITDDVSNYSLPCIQDNPAVLKVWTNGQSGDQYFLVANYYKKKNDANRPGQGLLVLHIDDSVGGGNGDNANEDHKHVDVESARGASDPSATNPKDPLDDEMDNGHANDLFFVGNSDTDYTGVFNDTSNPHSRNYPNPGSNTNTSLSNISVPGETMTLDIHVVTATAPTCTITSPTAGAALSGNATIEATATAKNARSITKVEFYCNDAFLGSDATPPYVWTFNTKAYYNAGNILKAVAIDSGGEIDTSTVNITISNSATPVPYNTGFENGVQDWAAYHRMGTRRWQRWDTRKYEGSYSAGVGTPSDGFDFDEQDELVSQALDLTGLVHPIALWRQRYAVADGENNCYVFASNNDGASWTLLQSYTGSNLNWHPAAADLTLFAGQTIRLMFKLDGSSLNNQGGEAGWWLDNLEVRQISAAPAINSITPVTGSSLTGDTVITVNASDDVGVTAVEFIIDGSDEIYADYAAPFTYTWNSAWCFDGSHTFKAVAYDGDMQSISSQVSWTTDNPAQALRWRTDFESDPGAMWRIENRSGTGVWQWLSGMGYGASTGFRLVNPGDSVYGDNDNDWLVSPTIDLTGVANPYLWFYHKYDIEDGGSEYDKGWVYITTDLNTWHALTYFSGENQPWAMVGQALGAYSGQQVKLAWVLDADGGVTYGGWWLDNVEVNTKPTITSLSPGRAKLGDSITINGTGFGNGTAFETPLVTVGGITAVVSNWTESAVTITVPAGVHSGDSVVVSRHGVASAGAELRIILAPPVLDGVGELP
jgi:M6 family metalloprotease-like protein